MSDYFHAVAVDYDGTLTERPRPDVDAHFGARFDAIVADDGEPEALRGRPLDDVEHAFER